MVIRGDAEHAPEAPAVGLGDPGGLPGGVVVCGIVGDDPCDQRLEGGVPPELGGVHLAVGHDDPPQVAWLAKRPDSRLGELLVWHGRLLPPPRRH
jgi:hypothetical protein